MSAHFELNPDAGPGAAPWRFRQPPKTMSNYFSKSNDLVTRTIAGETIIVPVRAHVVNLESIYSTDEVGSLIWQLIDGRRAVEQIAEAVCESYEVDQEKATTDVREFLAGLEEAGLIRSVPDEKGDDSYG